jgi:hypothetical protein
MISIFSLKPTITVDCYTHRPEVYNLSKIDYATNFFPNWWKKLPKLIEDKNGHKIVSTIKMCEGFRQLYENGLMIPLWTDFILDERGITFADGKSAFQVHPSSQMEGFLGDNFKHFKILSPWIFSTKKYCKFIWLEPTWNFSDIDFLRVVPGVIDYKYQNTTNINFFFNLKNFRRIMFQKGSPLAHCIPLSEKRLIIKNHLVSKEEYDKISSISFPTTFFGKYKKHKEEIIKNEKRKCPFGFTS